MKVVPLIENISQRFSWYNDSLHTILAYFVTHTKIRLTISFSNQEMAERFLRSASLSNQLFRPDLSVVSWEVSKMGLPPPVVGPRCAGQRPRSNTPPPCPEPSLADPNVSLTTDDVAVAST